MMPKLEELQPYVNNRKKAAEKFGVTEKTIIRWLKHYGFYQPRPNYGCNKLNIEKAIEIRQLHKEGKSIKELAELYGVTFSTISRIIHNITYKYEKEVADVKVIYNVLSNPKMYMPD
jgi:transcriptional regulator with XRE-family HTH domain